MATWNDLRNYITSNYKIESDDGSIIRLNFNLPDGRSQYVLVGDTGQVADSHWASVETAIAEVGQIDPRNLLLRNGDLRVGNIGVYENGVVIYQYSVRLNDLDASEIDEAIKLVVLVGDDIEHQLTGADTY